MSNRKLPPHIVLPNGMWRYVKKGAKKKQEFSALRSYLKSNGKPSRPRRAKKPRTASKVMHVARRRYFGKKRFARARAGIGSITTLAQQGLAGVGAAHFAQYVPVNLPYKEEVVGGAAVALTSKGGLQKRVIAGLVGAGAVFAAKAMQGGGQTGSGPGI